LASNRSATSFEQVRTISTCRDSSNLLESGRRPVRGQIHYAIWFEVGRGPVADLLRTSFEPDSIMEFGLKSFQNNVNKLRKATTPRSHQPMTILISSFQFSSSSMMSDQVFAVSLFHFEVVTDYFSGPGRAIGSVRVSVCSKNKFRTKLPFP